EAPPVAALLPGQLRGIPASPGIAIGPAYLYEPTLPEIERRSVEDPEAEITRLREAIQAARREIQTLRTQAAAQVGDYEAAIFDAHLLFLDDPALVKAAYTRIREARINAEAAWQEAVDAMVAAYQALDDPYLQARAGDVADVGHRVLRLLTGVRHARPHLEQPGILIAADLTPSDTAQLDVEKVLGIATALGGATSHSAILARALGIPAVVGVGPDLLRLAPETRLALNGDAGLIHVDPDEAPLAQFQAQRRAWLARQEAARATGQAPAVTLDGHRVEVVANIRGVADARVALEYGAEGVGLLRTEFLYLDRETAPSEEEQLTAYQAIAQVMGQRPLIIRTLDVGGDKPIPYLDLG
ncbi:MAG: phosphoenolpyruvate--protein phosphotransferase, partial [Chloroflexi bacterium]